ncbi:MAG TPA: hypothetical protein VHQ66_08940 [Myxococcota bacterium]|jgi:hypothetical protein|nr:hypothetical protein [Myxococcota bacterium]
MAEARSDPPGRGDALRERLRDLGRELAAREAAESARLDEARKTARALHAVVAQALAAFHEAARGGGAPQLEVQLEAPRTDDKHLRAVQFALRRGRHAAIVTVKSRGEVTLVGPFRQGKDEGPCKTFPFDATPEIDAALGDFLAAFLREAAAP